MNHSRKTLGIIITILGLILLGLFIYFFFLNKDQVNNVTNNQTTKVKQEETKKLAEPKTTPGDKPRNHKVYDISNEPAHKFNMTDASKLAMAFSERFGSYSSQSNYSNFSDLKIFMTESMRRWAEKYVAQLKKDKSSTNDYYGISTKAINSEVIKFDDKQGIAEIVVVTRRQESTSEVDKNKNYTQNIKISLRKVNGDWLVDKAYWQ